MRLFMCKHLKYALKYVTICLMCIVSTRVPFKLEDSYNFLNYVTHRNSRYTLRHLNYGTHNTIKETGVLHMRVQIS